MFFSSNKTLKKLAVLLSCFFLGALQLGAQNISVSGTVTDQKGEPLIGVGVIQKGTTNGVATDLEGHYSVSVPAGAILEFSSIGYQTRELAARAGVLDVVLQEDSEMLEETVVIGYGVQKKSNVTGAISSVDTEQLTNISSETIGHALQGKTAGVQILTGSGRPGASTTIRIRGFASSTESTPLFLVDGLKVSNIDYLDMESVESIEILKDAASAAIYGAQAGNGIVLITTKTGKPADNGFGNVFYNNQFTFERAGNLPSMMNAKQYIDFQLQAGNFTQETLDNVYDGHTDTNWPAVVYETGSSQRHTFGFNGANDKGSFYVSFSDQKRDGIFAGDKDVFERMTIQANADYKIKKWLKVSSTISLVQSKSSSLTEGSETQSAMASVLLHDPLTPVTLDNNNLPDDVKQNVAQGKRYLRDEKGEIWGMSYINESQMYNPFFFREMNDNYRKNRSINGTFSLDLTPFKGFTFTSKLGYTAGDSYSYSFDNIYYYNPLRSSDKISLSINTSQVLYYQWENYANYLRDFGKHTLSAMAGMSYMTRLTQTANGSTDELTSPAENFRYLSYSTSGAVDSVSGTDTQMASISYFGRLGWTYDNKYNLQATIRADAYDTSKLDASSRWGFFPSVSAGWTVSNEDFFRNLIPRHIVSSLKFRASWGVNGNVNVLDGYQYVNTLAAGYFYMDGTGGITYGTYPQTQLANPSLRWERSVQMDVGFDARLFNDRLTFSADYYNKNTDGLLVNITPALSTGASSQYVNAGVINNHGFEFELGWKDSIGDFSYSLNANLATVRNLVVDAPSLITGTTTHAGTTVTYFEEGYPVWYLRTYKVDHLDENGYAVYKDIDGKEGITDADREFAGSAIPDFTYGFSVSLAYKNWTLSAQGAGVSGNELYNGLNAGIQPTYNRMSFFYTDMWTPTHTDTMIPCPAGQFDNIYYASDGMVFDASYFRIKQIQLAYDLPKNLLKKVHIQSLRLFASLEDFFTFTKYPGLDPEAMTNNAKGMAVDKGAYPVSKKISFGINLKF